MEKKLWKLRTKIWNLSSIPVDKKFLDGKNNPHANAGLFFFSWTKIHFPLVGFMILISPFWKNFWGKADEPVTNLLMDFCSWAKVLQRSFFMSPLLVASSSYSHGEKKKKKKKIWNHFIMFTCLVMCRWVSAKTLLCHRVGRKNSISAGITCLLIFAFNRFFFKGVCSNLSWWEIYWGIHHQGWTLAS